MKEFWDSRYKSEDYAYGKEPNVFFADQIGNIPPGKLLLPCEGEGRNAVFAAALGWEVDAVDFSESGREKAMTFAKKSDVNFKYYINKIEEYKAPTEFYDAIGLVYAHFHKQNRNKIHAELIKFLKPGGWIILEAFSKKQIPYESGGPKDVDMLYDVNDLKQDFGSFKKVIQQELLVELDEGEFHRGKAMVVRYVGRKA
jgi:2-polyprenyl-3-methyl-5-hydroxy-6-metoxy-1,4-benzoquinol methylase